MTPGRLLEPLDIIELIRSGFVPRLTERLLRVQTGPDGPEAALPVFPRERTLPDRHGRSSWRHAARPSDVLCNCGVFNSCTRNRPDLTTHRDVRLIISGRKLVRHRQRRKLVGFQRNLLRQHDVSSDEITAVGDETPT